MSSEADQTAELMRRGRLLIVSPDELMLPGFEAYACVHLSYQFVPGPSPDGFSAWWSDSETGDDCVYKASVLERCHSLQGGYQQQALNRLFSGLLLRYRPDAIVVVGLHGCTLDLSRIASLMGVPAVLVLDQSADSLFADLDRSTSCWVRDALSRADLVCSLVKQTGFWQSSLSGLSEQVGPEELPARLAGFISSKTAHKSFDYALYEFCQRDHPLLVQMQMADTRHFQGCEAVLDLGCGAGIFLDLLRRQRIGAVGVERDPAIAEYGRGMGLDIITEDAIHFLEHQSHQFDGIYCAHFVEHLPFDVVRKLISLLAARLQDNGVLVLVFPDPESIRSQLLGFWRDPEHVRFYHPELIMTVARAAGLECEWSSYDDQPHEIVSFELAPEPLSQIEPMQMPVIDTDATYGFWDRLMRRLGLVSGRRFRSLEQQMRETQQVFLQHAQQQQQLISDMAVRTEHLWSVNRTWAWPDNVVLKLRKRS
ncbi:class I SAM-dependent methyltransferase [Nitrincola alkalilacustris]|uniref:class I SAM-dependent methyltransferase n=1 Tax=Nitrincola alkalilacustris TaxID=1571224 RepID=UPI00124E5CBC|nr:class I SAM-dependent methyltransferase [Nitrincola alkalilacustris]